MAATRPTIWPYPSKLPNIFPRRRATCSFSKASKRTGGNVASAKEVGKRVAERAKEKGIAKVVFDRGGYLYHGRIKALADAARAAGLQF